MSAEFFQIKVMAGVKIGDAVYSFERSVNSLSEIPDALMTIADYVNCNISIIALGAVSGQAMHDGVIKYSQRREKIREALKDE